MFVSSNSFKYNINIIYDFGHEIIKFIFVKEDELNFVIFHYIIAEREYHKASDSISSKNTREYKLTVNFIR